MDFGSTVDVAGIYRTIARLIEVAKYAANHYWPWFEEHILWEE